MSTDDVPNDIPLVGGLITEAFQTPLAHVNVLSQNRGTPNAGLAGARGNVEGVGDGVAEALTVALVAGWRRGWAPSSSRPAS